MYRVKPSEIDIQENLTFVQDIAAGAVVTFVGTVREYSEGKKVTKLLYEARESMAEKAIKQICDVAREKWNIQKICVQHRTGMLQVGDVAVVIAVSAPHRMDAFQACEFIIDRLKEDAPIWKKEFYESGEEWIGTEKK